MASRILSDPTHPLCVLFSCSLFTGQASDAIMLMLADLLFLPLCGTVGPLPLTTLYQQTTNTSIPLNPTYPSHGTKYTIIIIFFSGLRPD